MAAEILGIEERRCILADGWTDDQKRAYIIADNKIAENSGWDKKLLTVELQHLEGVGFDLEVTGFDIGELKGFDLYGVEEEEDSIPPLKEVPVTKKGDIWIMSNHRLMCGDSRSIDSVNDLMDGKLSDMVFTDPPYGVDYDGISNDDRSGLPELLDQAFSNYFATSKPGAAIYCFHSDRCADIFHREFRKRFHFSSMIIWFKNSLTLSQTDYQSQHEPCLYGWMNNGAHSWEGDRKQTSVWSFDKERVHGHTTPKPITLIETALLNSSKDGAVVSDFFGGSGGTMIACEKTRRSCMMMELEELYCDLIIRRWEAFTGEDAIHAQTGKTFKEISGV